MNKFVNVGALFAPIVVATFVTLSVTLSVTTAGCATLFGNPRQDSACENAKVDVEARFGTVKIHDCKLLTDQKGEDRVWVEIEVSQARDVSFSSTIDDAGLRRTRRILSDILTGKSPPETATLEAKRLASDDAICPKGRCPEADILNKLSQLSGVDPLRAESDVDAQDLAIATFLFRSGRPLEAAGRIKRTAFLSPPAPGALPLFARSLGHLGDVDTAIDLMAADIVNHKETTRDLLDDLLFIGSFAVDTPYLMGRRLDLAIASWERYLELVPESPQHKRVVEGLLVLQKRRTVETIEVGPVEPVRVVFGVPKGNEVGASTTSDASKPSKTKVASPTERPKVQRFVPLLSGESYEVRGRGEIQFLRFFAEWRGYGPAALIQERANGDVRHRLIFALTPAVERLYPRAIALELQPRFVAQMR